MRENIFHDAGTFKNIYRLAQLFIDQTAAYPPIFLLVHIVLHFDNSYYSTWPPNGTKRNRRGCRSIVWTFILSVDVFVCEGRRLRMLSPRETFEQKREKT